MPTSFTDFMSNFKPNRASLRMVTLAFLLLILISRVSWTRQFLGNIFNFPEIRYSVQIDETKTPATVEKIQVQNIGFGNATNVFMHIVLSGGSISKFKIDSEEAYTLTNESIEEKTLDVAFERLGAGASVAIELVGLGIKETGVQVSIVSDQGRGSHVDLSSLSGQVDKYGTGVIGLFSEAGAILWKSITLPQLFNNIVNSSFIRSTLRPFSKSEFQTVIFAVALLYFVLILFVPNSCITTSLICAINGLIVLSFLKVSIPLWLICLIIYLFAALFLDSYIIDNLLPKYSDNLYGLIVLLLLFSFGIAVWWLGWLRAWIPVTWLIALLVAILSAFFVDIFGPKKQPPKMEKQLDEIIAELKWSNQQYQSVRDDYNKLQNRLDNLIDKRLH